MSLIAELRRRNVFRVAAAYVVAGWLVLEVASVLMPALLLPEWSVTLVATLIILGFPIALFFAWAYELTPDGIRRDAGDSEARPLSTGRKVDFLIIGGLIIGIGFLLWERQDEAPVPEPAPLPVGQASIAVLPFADMSPDKDQEHFSDGMAEELLNLLAKVPDLKVAARTSTFRFKGENRDIGEIARMLGVDHVLEGSVRKSGNRIRVTAQLIDARDGFHIWSESYDEQLNDVLGVQDRISRQILQALSERLGLAMDIQDTATGTLTEGAAYDHYLRGKYAKHLRTPQSMLTSVKEFEQATILDPGMAAAWGGLSRSARLASEIFPERVEEFRALARSAEQRALSIDPNEPQALGRRAALKFSQLDLVGGLEDFERTVEVDPSDTEAMAWLAQRYRAVGFLDKAEAMNRRAYAMDPLSPRVVLGIVSTLVVAGKFAEAREITERAMDELAGHDFVIMSLLEVKLASGDLEDVDRLIEQLRHRPFFYLYFWVRAAAARGDYDALQTVPELASQLTDDSFTRSYFEIIALYFLGDEHARERLRQLMEDEDEADLVHFMMKRPTVRRTFSETQLRSEVDFTPWVEDYPEIIAGYEGLGIDLLAEVREAAADE